MYDAAVAHALQEHEPSVGGPRHCEQHPLIASSQTLVQYLLKLARSVSVAHRTARVKGAESEELAVARLRMFHCARTVIGRGMGLLGLRPLDRV